MAEKATRYQRIVYEYDTRRVVPLGTRGHGRVTCTTLPDSMEEVREPLRKLNGLNEPFGIGSGDHYILHNRCEIEYFKNGKRVRHLKD